MKETIKMLKCPYCGSDLKLEIGYTGMDWETVAGKGSGYGHVIHLSCMNDYCATVFPLVHVNDPYNVSVVKKELRHFKETNL